jgi:hypothetical protein
MAGKNPAFQFYPSDWSRDLEEHPLEIEGAWIRICCKLWWSETRGELSRTIEQWARILRVDQAMAVEILRYLSIEKIGDVKINGALGFSINFPTPNDILTVISRRMIKDERNRNLNTLRQRKWYDKQKPNAEPKQYSQDSSVLLSSSSKEKILKKEKIVFVENRFINIPDDLMEKWKSIAPAISIKTEIAKAEAWVFSNPKLKKSNWSRFLTNWIIKAQDNTRREVRYDGGNGRRPDSQGGSRIPEYTGETECISDQQRAENAARLKQLTGTIGVVPDKAG